MAPPCKARGLPRTDPAYPGEVRRPRGEAEFDGFAMCGNFQRGDAVVEIDETSVEDIQDLSKGSNKVGPRWAVTFIRSGERGTSMFPS